MVATVDEIIQIVRANPFIDGIGYFIEATTVKDVEEDDVDELTTRLQDEFCAHSQVTLEGSNVLGFDFHEHILTQAEDDGSHLDALQAILHDVESRFGVDHLCIEFQFDLARAKRAKLEVDDLLKP